MSRNTTLARRAGLTALLALIPAGCGPDHAARRQGAPPGAYVVQRPAYPVPGTKPLFLGSYAGASYGPGPRAGR